ncbi:MAG: ion transporter [Deltaproteobacteria bacterium]|nr:ion transporter [Deltaproteobacteria bacterium]
MVDGLLLLVILLSVAALALNTVDDVSRDYGDWLEAIQLCALIIFCVEYVLRVWSAAYDPDKSPSRGIARFVFSGYGLIDLAAILPSFLESAGFVSLRCIRLLRIFRVLRVARFASSFDRLARVLRRKAPDLLTFAFLALIIMLVSAVGIYYAEHDAQPKVFSSIPECLWWAIVTLTTVGYGDSYPITPGGKLFTSVILLLGLAIVAVPTGIIASGLTEDARDTRRQSE